MLTATYFDCAPVFEQHDFQSFPTTEEAVTACLQHAESHADFDGVLQIEQGERGASLAVRLGDMIRSYVISPCAS